MIQSIMPRLWNLDKNWERTRLRELPDWEDGRPREGTEVLHPSPFALFISLSDCSFVSLMTLWNNRNLNAPAGVVLWKVDSETKISNRELAGEYSGDQHLWGKGKQQHWTEEAGLRCSYSKASAIPTGSTAAAMVPQSRTKLGRGMWAFNPALTNHWVWAAPRKCAWLWGKRVKIVRAVSW